jgi:hypothetical protein
MPFVRFLTACLVALTCLGSSHAVAGAPIPGKGSKPTGATLLVEICFGDECGPKTKGSISGGQLGASFPPLAKQAGTITASRPLNFKCPGACQGKVDRPVKVTLRAVPARDRKFEGWLNACAPSGAAATCTIPLQGTVKVRAVFVRSYY